MPDIIHQNIRLKCKGTFTRKKRLIHYFLIYKYSKIILKEYEQQSIEPNSITSIYRWKTTDISQNNKYMYLQNVLNMQ
jgi:hypothetical protein